jgi:transcriptional regulator with PAS, ATPase and Fis domain
MSGTPAPPTAPHTFELLADLHVRHGLGRQPHLAEAQGEALVAELRRQFGLPPAFQARLATTVQALHGFLRRIKEAGTVDIYGPALARSMCHALFGADLRLTLLGGPGRVRRILLLGETGSGKEAVAEVLGQTLHALEGGQGSFRALNAASLTDSLADSELFGHQRGAFTGASRDHEGLVGAVGDGGVLFLDEIAEASPAVQARLLRVIQSGEYRSVGAAGSQRAHFHVVAATNRPKAALRMGDSLRADLYHRLARPAISLPPLRAMLEEPHRAKAILDRLVGEVLQQLLRHPEAATVALDWIETWRKELVRELAGRTFGYGWPGNLRECTAFIEEVLYQGPAALPVLCADLVGSSADRPGRSRSRAALGKRSLHEALAAEEGRLLEAAAAGARTIEEVARQLGITRQTASRRLAFFGLAVGAGLHRSEAR